MMVKNTVGINSTTHKTMKYHILSVGLLAALAVSCSVNEIDYSKPDVQSSEEFYAQFENPGIDPSTKVYATEDLYIRWNTDDRITIFNKYTYNQEYRFNGETGDNSGAFKRVDNGDFVTGNSLDNIYAIYPYLESTKISDTGVMTVTLPSEQKYAENTFGLGANTMISATKDNQLMFKNVGGYLMLKLYGDDVSVSSITLKGNNGEKLSGKATISMPVDGIPTVEMSSEAGEEITLVCDTPVKIGTTAGTATTFWMVVPPTVFSKGFTLTVKDDKGGIFEKITTKSIEIRRSTLLKMSQLCIEVSNPVSEQQVVDLGLSVKWGLYNLGASTNEDYGDYFAWGEVEPKNQFDWDNYIWCFDGNRYSLTKYCNVSEYGYNGLIDNKTVLEPQDDAARRILGNNWRIPTKEEWDELMNNSDQVFTVVNNVAGYLVTSKVSGYTEKSLFLPAAGARSGNGYLYQPGNAGCYYSSSLYLSDPTLGYYFAFGEDGHIMNWYYGRSYGYSIRPIYTGPISFIPISTIVLSEEYIDAFVGCDEIIKATVLPENASDKTIIWTSDNPTIVTVNADGVIQPISPGSAVITASSSRGDVSASCFVKVEPYSGPTMVDLGLSVRWASYNLGATKPEELGNRYQWGDPTPKQNGNVNWGNYLWCNGDNHSLTKYCCDSDYGYNGFVDYKVSLEPEDDAATVALGGNWRIPTIEEVKELVDNCSWEWVDDGDLRGLYAVSNINGARVFFPVLKYVNWNKYLSSSLYADNTYYKYGDFQLDALSLYVDGSLQKGIVSVADRASVNYIRPVYGQLASVPVSQISIDRIEMTIPVDRTKTITASVLPENATDKVILWYSNNPEIATVNAGVVTGISSGQCTITAISHDGGFMAKCQVTVVPKSDPSFYSSTDFSKDGEVVILQQSTVGKGVNLILLGDGFVDTDMSSGGLYEQKMIEEMNQFFSYEPYKTYKNRFNVYCVKVVSTNKEYNSEQSDRAFTYEIDGRIYFRNSLCYEYAERVPNPNNQPLKVAVLFNINRQYARSFCNMSLFDGRSLAYIMTPEEGVLSHELGGHGFAFLVDEYVEYSGTFSEQSLLDQRYENYGYGANVDYHDTPSTVRWSRLLNDSRYAQEGLGLYEGAYLYPYGIYRPTENSIMRNHYLSTGKAFNAPSREQIYKTIMRYSVGDNWVYDYETFVNADAAGREQAAKVFNSTTGFTAVAKQQALKHQSESHMPPVITDRRVKEIEVDKRGNVTIIK
jgi:hypothetical protein